MPERTAQQSPFDPEPVADALEAISAWLVAGVLGQLAESGPEFFTIDGSGNRFASLLQSEHRGFPPLPNRRWRT